MTVPAEPASPRVRVPDDTELLALHQRLLFSRADDILARPEWRDVRIDFSGMDVWPLGLLGHRGDFTLGDLLSLWSRDILVIRERPDARPHFLVRIAGSVLSNRNQVRGFDEGSPEVRTGPLPREIKLGHVATALMRGWSGGGARSVSPLRLAQVIQELRR
jgi:hypothetical protein